LKNCRPESGQIRTEEQIKVARIAGVIRAEE
jgi:hypothetical protein